jgi:hypothetical protein
LLDDGAGEFAAAGEDFSGGGFAPMGVRIAQGADGAGQVTIHDDRESRWSQSSTTSLFVSTKRVTF